MLILHKNPPPSLPPDRYDFDDGSKLVFYYSDFGNHISDKPKEGTDADSFIIGNKDRYEIIEREDGQIDDRLLNADKRSLEKVMPFVDNIKFLRSLQKLAKQYKSQALSFINLRIVDFDADDLVEKPVKKEVHSEVNEETPAVEHIVRKKKPKKKASKQ